MSDGQIEWEGSTLHADAMRGLFSLNAALRGLPEGAVVDINTTALRNRTVVLMVRFPAGKILLLDTRQERASQHESHVQYSAETADEKHGLVHSVWTIDEVTFTDPHPYPGAQTLSYIAFGDPEAINVVIEGPTWLDLWKAADAVLGRSGEELHRFVQGFRQDEYEPRLLHLQTGS